MQILLFYLIFPLVIPAKVHTHRCISFSFFFFPLQETHNQPPWKTLQFKSAILRLPTYKDYVLIEPRAFRELFTFKISFLKGMSMCTEGQFISAVYYLELRDPANRNVTHSQDFQKQTTLVSALLWDILFEMPQEIPGVQFQPSEKSMNLQSILSQVLKMNNYYFKFFFL